MKKKFKGEAGEIFYIYSAINRCMSFAFAGYMDGFHIAEVTVGSNGKTATVIPNPDKLE